jgi:hypothetical protein
LAKICLLTDLHFGFKRQSTVFHDYFLKFYDEVFFPFLEKHSIRTVIDLGDTFDSRKTLDLTTIDWARKNFYNRLEELECDVHTIVGNHTTYYRNTNKINTPDLVLSQYKNVRTYSKPTEIIVNGLNILIVPWINQENEKETLELIQTTSAKVVMGHLELNGFYVNRGSQMEGGQDPDVFSKFKKVFTGHFHTRSDNGTIFYIGNPYEMFFSDAGDPRGFIVFDTETLKHSYVNNPNRLFDFVYYDDTDIDSFDFGSYYGKILKVIIRRKTDNTAFDHFINGFYQVGIADLKIIDNYSDATGSEDFDVDLESEDTFSLIQRYVDESDVSLNKDKLKLVLSEIYKEACELV